MTDDRETIKALREENALLKEELRIVRLANHHLRKHVQWFNDLLGKAGDEHALEALAMLPERVEAYRS